MSDSLDARLIELHDQGRAIPAIKLIRDELGLSLKDAKHYLHTHPAWQDDLEKWDAVLDQAIDELVAENAKPS